MEARRLDDDKLRLLVPDETKPAENAEEKQSRDFSKLVEIFGLGDRPDVRNQFYSMLVKALWKGGPKVRRDVSRIANVSMTKTSPGRYFCVAIARYCTENGVDLFCEEKLF